MIKKLWLILGITGAGFSPCFLFSLDFLRAVELNRSADVRRMVDEGADVNQSDPLGYTALHIASWNGSAEMVEYLLQMGANPNTITPSGNTALKFANPAIKNLLIRYGAHQPPSAPAPIIIERSAPAPIFAGSAASLRDTRPIIRVVSNFISNIISNTVIVSNIEYPRASYAVLKNISSDESILLHRWDNQGNNALHRAAEAGDFDAVTNLVARGINPQGRNNAGDTALRFAVEGGFLPIVKYFVETIGLDVNARNTAGTNPLMLAALSRKPEILEYLIKMGGNVNSTATVISTRTSSAGGPPVESTVDGWTPLMAAAQIGDVAAMRTLIDARATINTSDKGGYNALMYASQSGSLEAVRFLVDQGMSLGAVSEGGSTALSIAIDQKFTNIADYLRGLGAPDTKNPRYDINTTIIPGEMPPAQMPDPAAMGDLEDEYEYEYEYPLEAM